MIAAIPTEVEPTAPAPTSHVLLIRHTEVPLRWKSRCYGRSDIGLSRAGNRAAHALAARLAREQFDTLIHSGLRRTSLLAQRVADLKGIVATADGSWQERNFGAWEGRSWHSIWRQTGNAMDGMLTDPHGFRPGGGETTAELVARSVSAWDALPREGGVVVITHNGPIAAILAGRSGAPWSELANYRVGEGEAVLCRLR